MTTRSGARYNINNSDDDNGDNNGDNNNNNNGDNNNSGNSNNNSNKPINMRRLYRIQLLRRKRQDGESIHHFGESLCEMAKLCQFTTRKEEEAYLQMTFTANVNDVEITSTIMTEADDNTPFEEIFSLAQGIEASRIVNKDEWISEQGRMNKWNVKRTKKLSYLSLDAHKIFRDL